MGMVFRFIKAGQINNQEASSIAGLIYLGVTAILAYSSICGGCSTREYKSSRASGLCDARATSYGGQSQSYKKGLPISRVLVVGLVDLIEQKEPAG